MVVVVADDVGFSDLGAYGSEIRTPHIDAIASRGVVFSNFHASPMCSPSRAMLLTGVDAHLAGVASLYVATPLRHRGRPGYEGELRTDVVTIASRLRAAGYRTYLTGKWNLGHTPTSLPSARGFDRTFALDATGADNFEKKPYLPIYGEPPWFADGEPTDLPDDYYSSEHLVDKLIEFIEADRTVAEPRPFFWNSVCSAGGPSLCGVTATVNSSCGNTPTAASRGWIASARCPKRRDGRQGIVIAAARMADLHWRHQSVSGITAQSSEPRSRLALGTLTSNALLAVDIGPLGVPYRVDH